MKRGGLMARCALVCKVWGCVAAVQMAGAVQAQTMSMTDQNGRSVSVPVPVQRIASLVIPGASMVMTLDRSTERLVGINPAAREDMQQGMLGRFFPAAPRIAANMATEGFAPNIEALMNARPDVVLQWGDRGESIVRPMEQMGLNVLTLKYGQTDYVTQWFRLIGQATGRQERGNRLAAWIEQEQQSLRMQVAAIAPSQRPRVLFLYRYHGGVQVGGMGTNMDHDIRLAGGINVAGAVKGNAAVTKEQIVAWNPEVILLANLDSHLVPDDLYHDPILSVTTAVQARRLYKMPRGGFRWDPPSQETPLAWRWLAGLLHPERFALQGFRERVRNTYQDLYAATVSEADLDRVLQMPLNQSSRGYQVLRAGGKP